MKKRSRVNPRKDRRVFSRTASNINGRNDSVYSRTGKRL